LLRALLQLPSLTALSLPWIDEALLIDFRAAKQQLGRASQLVERAVPPHHRPRVERQ